MRRCFLAVDGRGGSGAQAAAADNRAKVNSLVGRNMGLAVLLADEGASAAANAAAGIVDDHDHPIELAIEVVASPSYMPRISSRVIDAVKANELARAHLEAAGAATDP